MTTKPDGGAAFPTSQGLDCPNEMGGGLTVRQYFAAHAPEVPPAIDFPFLKDQLESENWRCIRWRWAYADMMIAEGMKNV